MYYVNGAWVENGIPAVHPEDRGYQFGDGVYEVVRIYRGKLYMWEDHVERLRWCASEIELSLPWTADELKQIAQQLMEKNNFSDTVDGLLYLQVTRGVAPRQHDFPEQITPVLSGFARHNARPLEKLQSGVSAVLLPDIRWLRCDIKSLNLLGAAMAKQQAKKAGAFEAILHRDGIITEGSSTNVIAVKENALYTHPADNFILHGITRKVVLSLAGQLGIPVYEQAFDTNFLMQADEVLVTSTSAEVMPIIQLDGQPIGDGQPGSVARRLQAAFDQHIQTQTVTAKA